MCGKVSKHGHVRSHALTYLVQTGLKSLKYKNMWDALINIPREEGRQTGDGRIRIHALYRGLLATMIGLFNFSRLTLEGFGAWGPNVHTLDAKLHTDPEPKTQNPIPFKLSSSLQ